MATALAYKFTGAGHEMPEEKRKYAEPDKRLEKAFERWMDKTRIDEADESGYLFQDLPKNALVGIEATVDQAHALLIKYQDDPVICLMGKFISAIYNKTPDKVIVYDLDLRVDCLADNLEGNKIFINTGKTGFYLGADSSGIIINNGETTDHFGDMAKGIIINNGIADSFFIDGLLGTAINNGRVGRYMGNDAKGTIINNGIFDGEIEKDATGLLIDLKAKNIPELKQYLDNLKLQLTNPNMDEVLKVLDGLTKEKLSTDITDILERAK